MDWSTLNSCVQYAVLAERLSVPRTYQHQYYINLQPLSRGLPPKNLNILGAKAPIPPSNHCFNINFSNYWSHMVKSNIPQTLEWDEISVTRRHLEEPNYFHNQPHFTDSKMAPIDLGTGRPRANAHTVYMAIESHTHYANRSL